MLNDSTHDGKIYIISVSRYKAIKGIQRIGRTFQFDGLPLMVHRKDAKKLLELVRFLARLCTKTPPSTPVRADRNFRRVKCVLHVLRI